ncbi:hypothetical protein REPUB_Repub04eG0000700 [Reevesia pubescens]
MKGNPDPAGYGGVLRDCFGVMMAIFSGPLGILNMNETELLAIRLALEVFVEANLMMKWKLIIESMMCKIKMQV